VGLVYCRGKREGDWPCHHEGPLPLERFRADEALRDIERHCRCTACGWRRADLRPDYGGQQGSATECRVDDAAQDNLISASPGKVVNFEQKILLMSARLIQSQGVAFLVADDRFLLHPSRPNAPRPVATHKPFLSASPKEHHHVVISCLYSKCLSWRIDRNCNWSGFGQNFSVCQLTSIFVAILLCVLVELGSCGTLDRA
jgi:hypothetical protein